VTNSSYIFTGNGIHLFTFTDLNGNTGSVLATVNRINKSPVTGTVSYLPASLTNQNVVATISFNKTGVTLTNNSGSSSYEFTNNGSFIFRFVDSYGNEGQTEAQVNRIDRTSPYVVDASYASATATNQDVLVTLTMSESVQAIAGWTRGSGGTVFSKSYSHNESESLLFYDIAGNTGTYRVEIDWIDKSPVTAAVLYSSEGPTSGNVIASLSFNKPGVTVTNNEGFSRYTFTADGSFTFNFQDAYGNTGSATATVTGIDKTTPTCQISYTPSSLTNKNVLATLTNCNKEIIVTSSGGMTHLFADNGVFQFTFVDYVGNTGRTNATVTRIDKSSIVANLTYSPVAT